VAYSHVILLARKPNKDRHRNCALTEIKTNQLRFQWVKGASAKGEKFEAITQ
jgi:hypothetical protein